MCQVAIYSASLEVERTLVELRVSYFVELNPFRYVTRHLSTTEADALVELFKMDFYYAEILK